MDIHDSARRHGIGDDDIDHASVHAVLVVDLEPEADPPKLLVIGPDRAGNMLQLIILTLAADRMLAIHAMPLREKYFDLLPRGGNQDG